ncbi:Serine/threonine protein kinase [Parasponia andersonii]|uniref:non-specific serine/threonine protein kinase n=1 Tax=Parasponia andersonii TaxID=3476 RepID=A0A2P5BV55_PARAD|nr:Serine/threonine protein kinase [Parasponia andersonii]
MTCSAVLSIYSNNLHYLSSSSVNKNKKSYGKSPLSLEARHKIITGVAKGLAYIHDLDKPIIHRDVKARNVLLNAEMEAKISNFRLARRIESEGSQVSSQAVGTEGYMPPEYEEGSRVATVKGDVYSFGILILETVTGKKPFLSVDLNSESMSFLEWTRVMVAQNRVRGMLDANIWVCDSQRGLEEDNIKEYFRIAFMCVDVIPKKRPAMRDVVELLTRSFL